MPSSGFLSAPLFPASGCHWSTVSVDVLVLDIADRWSGLLCLAPFPQRGGFKVHPCCNICQYFIPFYGWMINILGCACITFGLSTYQLVDIWLFPLSAVMNNAAVNPCVQVFTWIYVCFIKSSLGIHGGWVLELPADTRIGGCSSLLYKTAQYSHETSTRPLVCFQSL